MDAVLLLIGLLGIAGAIMVTVYVLMGGNPANDPKRILASIDMYQVSGLPDADTIERSMIGTPPLPPVMDRFRQVAARLSPATIGPKLQHRLDLAGNPVGWTPERVLSFKGLGLLIGGAVGAFIGVGLHSVTLLWLIGGSVVGFFLPDYLLMNAGQKRQSLIQKRLPNALDMMTVCVEAGLGFDAALAQVARNTEGPVAAEFARVLQEMQFGKSRVEALRSLMERTTVSELRVFVTSLVQASELGIPIASVLREQAKEMRLRTRQRVEEQAQKIPIKILFPVICCLLPAMFIVIIGPGIMRIVDVFSS